MRTLCLSILILLTACDFTPQQVDLAPAPKVAPSQQGRGLPVAVTVKDEWSTRSEPIGYWGKPESHKAPITTGNLSAPLKQALEQALVAKGFTAGHDGARTLHATLVDFDYRNDYSFWKIGMHADVEMEVNATRGGEHYTRLYSTHVERWWMMAPSEKKNAKYLNKALTELVEQVAEDQKLLQFLAAP